MGQFKTVNKEHGRNGVTTCLRSQQCYTTATVVNTDCDLCLINTVCLVYTGGGDCRSTQHPGGQLVSVPTSGQSGRLCQDVTAGTAGKHREGGECRYTDRHTDRHTVKSSLCRAQRLRGRAFDPRLREPGF